jgi:cysteine synthase A
MSRKVNDITELVGNTPIVRLNRVVEEGSAAVWCKLEYYNPAGSVKDRIGLGMIVDAEKRGLLKPGDTIVEPTSGNTGIALAFVAAQRGYRLILTMPETMSQERRDLLSAYGAELVLVKPDEGPGMTGAIKRAEQLAQEHGYFMPQQFKNLANPQIHETTTGPEVVEAFKDTGLDFFVSGVGTGGTITGAGKVLRQHFPNIKIYAVEPKNSPVLSGGKAGRHAIQGIGAGFVPEILNTSIYDGIIQVSDEDARETTRRIAKEEGILVGISSGAAAYAALQISEGKGRDKHLLVIFPDTGERYLSTGLFGEK